MNIYFLSMIVYNFAKGSPRKSLHDYSVLYRRTIILICWYCRCVLTPGRTSRVSVENRGGVRRGVTCCNRCGTSRSVPMKEKKKFDRSSRKKKNKNKK